MALNIKNSGLLSMVHGQNLTYSG